MSDLIKRYAQRIGEEAARDFMRSPAFKEQINQHLKWAIQGFEPGYKFKDREAFTATVAERIREKARRPIMLLGLRIWRARIAMDWCAKEAERIVTEFLKDNRIQFGDPRFDWRDGVEIADADMDYWEDCA